MLAAATVRDLLHYDPETGVFRWRCTGTGRRPDGIAGTRHPDGWRFIRIRGRGYGEHRVAWLYMTGRWPADQIDHINMVRDDNRFANLREADQSLNQRNKRKSRGETGVLGAFRNGRRFMARIHYDGRQCYLGTFETAEEAGKAYQDAKRIHHPGAVPS